MRRRRLGGTEIRAAAVRVGWSIGRGRAGGVKDIAGAQCGGSWELGGEREVTARLARVSWTEKDQLVRLEIT